MASLANILIFPSSSSSLDLGRRSHILHASNSPHSLSASFLSFPSSRRNFPSDIAFGSGFSTNKLVCVLPDNAATPAPLISEADEDHVPMPIVLIGQDPDSEATTVQLSFGNRLGALIDTMKALKDLGLNVTKGTAVTVGSETQTKFFITRLDTGRKVEDPDMLERIRLTVINNLLQYHPESSVQLAMGEAFGLKAPKEKLDVDIATHLHVKEDGPRRSLLYVETADRPGLILEIIKILSDINVDVVSAKIDTEGLIAKDRFHVSYRGAALNSSLSQILVNCLRFYLRRPETDIDSY